MTTRQRVAIIVVTAVLQAFVLACAEVLLFPVVGWGGVAGGVIIYCAIIGGMIFAQMLQARQSTDDLDQTSHSK